jgi:hypothetical protein
VTVGVFYTSKTDAYHRASRRSRIVAPLEPNSLLFPDLPLREFLEFNLLAFAGNESFRWRQPTLHLTPLARGEFELGFVFLLREDEMGAEFVAAF